MESPAIAAADADVLGLIENPDEAARLFVRLRRQRNLVTVRPAASQREYASMLLSLDAQQGYLVLDAPQPTCAPGTFARGTRIYARTQVDGAALVFVTQVDGSIDTSAHDNSAGDAGLLCDWPSRISHFQRRQDYRVSVPTTLVNAPARLLIEGRAAPARLVDLSASGAAVLIMDLACTIHEGDELPCILPLPKQDLRMPFVVRNLERTRAGLRVGGELLLDGPAQQEALLHAVTTIERWWLQQHP